MKQNLSTNLISIISITFAVISFFYGFYIDEISMGAGGYNGDFVFVTKSIDLGEFEISFISTIFGAMSAKVNTIIDFFFGGSSKKNEQIKEK